MRGRFVQQANQGSALAGWKGRALQGVAHDQPFGRRRGIGAVFKTKKPRQQNVDRGTGKLRSHLQNLPNEALGIVWVSGIRPGRAHEVRS
jgi:hypothetical protein